MSRIIKNFQNRRIDTGQSLFSQLVLDAVHFIYVLSGLYTIRVDHKSYSQYGEDKVLRVLLPEKYGVYLDVGSGHPISKSNTYWFYRKGWKGTLVEPIGSLVTKSKLKRPRDTIIQGVIGTPGLKKFWEFRPTEFSTSNPAQAEMCRARNVKLVSEVTLKSFVLSDIAPTMKPSEPSFIDIDAEGSDLEILKSNNWDRTKPRVLVVEDREILKESKSAISKFVESQGYVLISVLIHTCIYVHESFDLDWTP